jgi:hypothetical protein
MAENANAAAVYSYHSGRELENQGRNVGEKSGNREKILTQAALSRVRSRKTQTRKVRLVENSPKQLGVVGAIVVAILSGVAVNFLTDWLKASPKDPSPTQIRQSSEPWTAKNQPRQCGSR